MQTRRRFLQDMAALAGATGVVPGILNAIQRAQAIEPEKDSTFLDADHVVILMQENRSFDHAFGSLCGVRGFNDPRAIQLPDGSPVWVQTNEAGQKFVPFRLDIKETKTTWMGCLPHSWSDQVDAANAGKHDRWLRVKKSGTPEFASMPLTLGYHTRADLPFYYALADAFTICDQNFCSTLTGTTPNRLHLWTGTLRAKPTVESPALVRNEDCDYGQWVNWTTFPERLEDQGISWKIYQNELTVPSGLSQEDDAWLANFGDNPIEWFTQFNVRHAPTHRAFLEKTVTSMPFAIEALKKTLDGKTGDFAAKIRKRVSELETILERAKKDHAEFTSEAFAKLSPREKSLMAKAFCTNIGDPNYRDMTEIPYEDAKGKQTIKVPKGDVLYQFRKDVGEGKLPTVSWLVPPEHFSDHPCSAWYGQWYLSEVMNILTKNPEVWRKTIFILTYDENDGYFDHVPPFQAPHPKRPETGLASKGLDPTLEYLELEQDRKHKPTGAVRGNSLGLGFRVPMIIASPWSRGGFVCSQVFDHTSVLRFLEKLLTHKTDHKIEETNITPWRRGICGDLMAAFQPAKDAKGDLQDFLARDPFIEQIHQSKFKKVPDAFRALSAQEIDQISKAPGESRLPKQEPGVRRSCSLPYQLTVDGALNRERTHFTLHLEASKERFGERAAGSPFIVYALMGDGKMVVRNYAVQAGERLEDSWKLADFPEGRYHLRAYGPNGFYREFIGTREDASLELRLKYAQARAGETPTLMGAIEIVANNRDDRERRTINVRDNSYGNLEVTRVVPPGETCIIPFDLESSFGWYDLSVSDAKQLENRYAGRVETGRPSVSDPAMGRTGKDQV